MATTPLNEEYFLKNGTASSSFLNQLQNEWNEFLLGVSHSTPVVNVNITASSVNFLHNSFKELLTNRKNESIDLHDENLVVPVSLNVLKRLFSPSNFVADDAAKIEIFNNIKKNPDLTCDTLKKLRNLLFPGFISLNEVSDWPSPSPKRNIRHSAPPRLCPKNQRKLFSQPTGKKCPHITNAQQEVLKEKPNPITPLDLTTVTKIPAEPNRLPKNEAKENKTTDTQEKKELLYSSIYDLVISNGSDSASLFYDTAKYARKEKKWKPTIVFTYFNQIELAKMYKVVKKLGYFRVENSVTSRTTHVICGTSKKTINLCKAVARGCWVLNKNWIFESENENRWLLEERFEVSHLWPAIKENRLKRQKYGNLFQCDVFEKAGT